MRVPPGVGHVANEQRAARPQHPRRFARIAGVVALVDVVQAAAVRHEVDARVFDRDVERASLDPRHVHRSGLGALAGTAERLPAEIQPSRLDAQPCEEHGIAAGPAAHVDRRARKLAQPCDEAGQFER